MLFDNQSIAWCHSIKYLGVHLLSGKCLSVVIVTIYFIYFYLTIYVCVCVMVIFDTKKSILV